MNTTKWLVMLVMMLALTGFVMAEANNTDTNTTNTDTGNNDATQGQALSVRYDNVQCKVTFTDTQIDILKKYTTVDQTANEDKLVSDMSALKTLVDTTNKDGFDTYITNNIRPDLQKASQDLTDVKKNFRQYNVSNESRTAVITELKDAKNAYVACTNDKEIKMATVMETHMDNWNKQWGKIIDNMNKKNITMDDAVALQKEIDAKNTELKALIAEGNITQIQDFMQTYHDDQMHYPARFEISRLTGYKNKLAPLVDTYNMSGKIDDINQKIADAEKYIQPGYKFKDGEFNNTWSDIRGIGQDMKEIAKNITDERINARQGKIAERQQKIDNRQQRLPNRQGRGPGNRNNNTGNGTVDSNSTNAGGQ